MPDISVERPEVTTIHFRQNRSDKDYGSCLWARFNFDLKQYTLSIESDCGNYMNGWYPTPRSESFLALCGRFDDDYLLGKISERSVIDGKATFKNVKDLMEDLDMDALDGLSEMDMEEIEGACRGHREETAAYMAISNVLEDVGFELIDSYELACCIEKDYPAGAKKICQIYRDHIQPEVRKLAGEVVL